MKRYLAYNNSKWVIEYGDCKEIKKYINMTDTIQFELNYEMTINDTTVYYNDSDHKIALFEKIFKGKCLSIDNDYFKDNTKEVIDLILYIIKNYQSNQITIANHEFITEEILTAISENKNITNIRLGTSDKPFKLTSKIYNLLKKDHVEFIITNEVSEELEDNFDPIIYYNYYRNLIGYLGYQDINKDEKLLITKYEEEQLENIKYIPNDKEITFSMDMDEIKIIKFISKAHSLGKKFHYNFSLNEDQKAKFNMALNPELEELINEDIKIHIHLKEYSLKEYVEYEKKLTNLILPAMKLSPFEKYLYAYNVVKKFKEYKENEDDLDSSRNLYDILDNEYMVCVGYSIMLQDLLKKLGINCINYSCKIYTSYDELDKDIETIPDNTTAEYAGHARLTVKITDPKYGIDGIFVADPTWDNIMDKDAYNYALINAEELVSNKRYVFFQKYEDTELIMCKSIEEFHQKLLYILNHDNVRNISSVLRDLIKIIETIEPELYKAIIDNYPNLTVIGNKLTEEQTNEIVNILGNYFVSKANEKVDGNAFKQAITELYSQFSGLEGEELENKINEIMEYNRERQERAFPIAYIINAEGEKTPYMNEKNKFDIEISNEKAL